MYYTWSIQILGVIRGISWISIVVRNRHQQRGQRLLLLTTQRVVLPAAAR
jgi:hypothetical protein